MISRLGPWASGNHRVMGSVVRSFPFSSSRRMAAAVNCFVMEPRFQVVRVSARIPLARSANPHARSRTGLPSRRIRTAPE